MKKITLNVQDEVKRLLPETLEKNLTEHEMICPVCHGLGIIKRNQPFGVKDENSKWYDNEYFVWCPHCYFGIVELCEFCGKPLKKGNRRCNCEGFKQKEKEEYEQHYQKIIDKAKEVYLKETSYYLYDECSDEFFSDESEFVEYYWQGYHEDSKGCVNFDEYFEYKVPKILWDCSKTKISMDAYSIIESACEELHEDAFDDIGEDSITELQNYLDDWCRNQTCTETYCPDYSQYVKVEKEWFD